MESPLVNPRHCTLSLPAATELSLLQPSAAYRGFVLLFVVLLFVCVCVRVFRSLLGFGCFSRLSLCGWLALRCQPRASPDKGIAA